MYALRSCTHSTLHIHTQLALFGPLLETGNVKVFPIHACAFIWHSVMHTCTHTGTLFHALVNFCTCAAGSPRLSPVRATKTQKLFQGLPYLMLTRLSYIQFPCTPIKPMHAVHVLHTHIYMQLVLLGRLLLLQKKKNVKVFIILVCVLFAHTCTYLYPVDAYMYTHIRTSTFSCFISIAIFLCACSGLSGQSSCFSIHTERRKQRSYRG